jgi:hypothetical protein
LLKVALLGGCLLAVCCTGGVVGLGAYLFFGWQKGAAEERQKGTAEDDKRSAAKAQAKVLTQALEGYRITHGKWPPSLAALLQQDEEGGPWVKNPSDLIDPWGQPYQYNAAGPHNNGRQPDIWADSPSGPVGNWPG